MEFYAYAQSKRGFVDLGYHNSENAARQECYHNAKWRLGLKRLNWREIEDNPCVFQAKTDAGVTYTYGEVDRGQYDYERPSIY